MGLSDIGLNLFEKSVLQIQIKRKLKREPQRKQKLKWGNLRKGREAPPT